MPSSTIGPAGVWVTLLGAHWVASPPVMTETMFSNDVDSSLYTPEWEAVGPRSSIEPALGSGLLHA